MPVVLTVVPRTLCLEDLDLTINPAGQTVVKNVLGPSGSIPTVVNQIPAVLMTQYVVANNDTAAAGLGVGIGECYISTAGKLRTRLT